MYLPSSLADFIGESLPDGEMDWPFMWACDEEGKESW
jgi:hypothetical protein